MKTREIPSFETFALRERQSRFALVIFVLNERERLWNQLRASLPIAKDVDVIIADGGSNDGTVSDHDMLRALSVRALLVKTGEGRLSAQMRMAFSYALDEGYEGIITVDGNGKDDVVRGVPQFIQALDDGFDHIQGSRFIAGGSHQNTPLPRLLGVRLIHAPLISLAARHWYSDTTNGFRAYSRKLLTDARLNIFRDVFDAYQLHYFLAIEAAHYAFNVKEVPVTRNYPRGGAVPTKISPFWGSIKVMVQLLKTVIGVYR